MILDLRKAQHGKVISTPSILHLPPPLHKTWISLHLDCKVSFIISGFYGILVIFGQCCQNHLMKVKSYYQTCDSELILIVAPTATCQWRTG